MFCEISQICWWNVPCVGWESSFYQCTPNSYWTTVILISPFCGWYHQVQLIEAPFLLVPLVFSLLVNSKFRSLRNIYEHVVGSNPLSLMIQSSNPNDSDSCFSSWLNTVEPAWISGDFPLNGLVHSPLANRSPCLAQLPTFVYPNPPSSQEKKPRKKKSINHDWNP